MGAFIKKDMLVFWRDRKEVLMAFLFPIVLIVIINFAFSGLFSEDKAMDINIGLVVEDEESLGWNQFEQQVSGLNIAEQEKELLLTQAKDMAPVILIENLFQNPEMSKWIHSKVLTEKEALEQLEAKDLDAIVKVPEGFTFSVLARTFLEEPATVDLKIIAKKQSTELSALQNVLNNFTRSLNMQLAIGTNVQEMIEPELPQGGREVLEGVDTYTMVQYFTIAIGTLFGLFLAQTVGIKTITEKRERVFNRILLTNSNPFHFLLGKMVATFTLTCAQLLVTIGVVQLLLNVFEDKSLKFWIGLVVVILLFALIVAALSAVFVTITLNTQDSNAASGLSMLVVMTFGILGGSFFPIQGLPVFMQKIGEWTPNGVTQVALLKWIQFERIEDLIVPIVALAITFILFLVISLAMFPKRGRA